MRVHRLTIQVRERAEPCRVSVGLQGRGASSRFGPSLSSFHENAYRQVDHYDNYYNLDHRLNCHFVASQTHPIVSPITHFERHLLEPYR